MLANEANGIVSKTKDNEWVLFCACSPHWSRIFKIPTFVCWQMADIQNHQETLCVWSVSKWTLCESTSILLQATWPYDYQMPYSALWPLTILCFLFQNWLILCGMEIREKRRTGWLDCQISQINHSIKNEDSISTCKYCKILDTVKPFNFALCTSNVCLRPLNFAHQQHVALLR